MWMSEEAYDEMVREHQSGPWTLADAHRQWHYENGWDKVCDLDCGAGEALYYEDDEQAQHEADPAYRSHMFVGEPDEPVYDEPLSSWTWDTEPPF